MKKVISISLDIFKIVDKVLDAVDEYEYETGKKACLHMSRDTLESFTCPAPAIKKEEEIDETTGTVGEWEGTKFIIDDTLGFGTIEISEDIKV